MLMEMAMLIISVLVLIVNTGSFIISYCQYKKRAATTSNSDGSVTEK